jgi:hypothetical protein
VVGVGDLGLASPRAVVTPRPWLLVSSTPTTATFPWLPSQAPAARYPEPVVSNS